MLTRRHRLTRHWWLIPLTVLLAIVSLNVTETPPTITADATLDMRETQSDYYLESFSTRKFDAEGVLEYEVLGNSLAHYPADRRSEIIAPRVVLHQPDGRWLITSSTGELTEDPDIFRFVDDVVIERQSASAEPVVITTSGLAIHTEENTVSTDEIIEIRADTWHLSSVGMRSAIDEGNLTLLSDVSGQYEMPASVTEPAAEPTNEQD